MRSLIAFIFILGLVLSFGCSVPSEKVVSAKNAYTLDETYKTALQELAKYDKSEDVTLLRVYGSIPIYLKSITGMDMENMLNGETYFWIYTLRTSSGNIFEITVHKDRGTIVKKIELPDYLNYELLDLSQSLPSEKIIQIAWDNGGKEFFDEHTSKNVIVYILEDFPSNEKPTFWQVTFESDTVWLNFKIYAATGKILDKNITDWNKL